MTRIRKIVVVNDNTFQLKMAVSILRADDRLLLSFENVESALKEMNDNGSPDLIITDLHMPGIDGWRFCRLLRSEEFPAFNETPILLLSATFAGVDVEQMTQDLGANAFLSVPYQAVELRNFVNDLLEGKRPKSRPKILIIDDESSVLNFLGKTFEKNGYKVNFALDSRSARASLRMELPDVVLLDFHLPGENGVKILEEVRKYSPRTVVIMMTADSSPELALEFIQKGADAYLRKPFDPQYILELCRKAQRERSLLQVENILEKKIQELNRSESRLKETGERFQSILDSSPSLISLFTLDGRYLKVNKSLAKLYQKTEEEIIGLSFSGLMPDEYVETMMSRIRHVLEKRTALTAVDHAEVEDKTLYFSTTIFPLISEEGQITSLGSISTETTDQVQAEKNLARQKHYYESLLDEANIWIDAVDKDLNFILFNKAAERISGYKKEDVLGNMSLWERQYIDPVARKAIQDFCLSTMKFESTFEDLETEVTTADNDQKIISWSSNLIRDDHGTVVGSMYVGNDITERKRLEDEVRKSEELYRRLIEASPDPIVMYDLDGHFLTVNAKTAEIFGVSSPEAFLETVHDIKDVLDEEGAQKAKESVSSTLKKGFSSKNEYLLYRKDGTSFPVEINTSVVRDAYGSPKAFLSVVRDITERKRQEEQLLAQKELAEKLRSAENLVDAAAACLEYSILNSDLDSGAVYLIQDDSADLLVSSGLGPDFLEEVHHYGPESQQMEWIRQAKPLYFSRADTPEILKDAFQEENLRSFAIIPILHADKVIAGFVVSSHVLEEFSPAMCTWLESIGSQMGSAIARIRVIENKQQIEAQLQQAMKMEAVGRLAGGVAHDFNNLLTGITGNIELAMMDLNRHDPLYGTLAEINKAAMAASGLTRQLLAFSRKQIIEPKVLNLNDLITNLTRMLSRLIGEDILLETVMDPELGSVKVDPGQFEQILVNLSVNARDAMPEGGKLLIETQNAFLDKTYTLHHPYVIPGPHVMLTVTDTGHGMTTEVKRHIFEPFFTTKPKGRGAGLGLATIYGIVKQAKGSVEVYSEENVGTIFKIYLPRVDEAPEKIAKDVTRQELPTGTETILLVEDEPIVRDLAIKLLKRLGYHVLHAENGGEALLLAEKYTETIHLLLTDVIMPGMNGRQLSERVKLIHPEMKVLFTSGYTENVIVHHGMVEQGIQFIGKPYSPIALAKKIREILKSTK